MTLNGVMAVTLRYFTEFGKRTFQHITAASSCGGRSRLYFVARVPCRRKESSRSLSHLMSFLLLLLKCTDLSEAISRNRSKGTLRSLDNKHLRVVNLKN